MYLCLLYRTGLTKFVPYDTMRKKGASALEVLHRPAQLRAYLERFHIGNKFTAPDLRFRLLRFEKGECMTAPYQKLEDILFFVKGS